MNNEFILVLFIIFLGFCAKSFKIITEKDGESLAKLVFNFTLPAIIIDTFSAIKIDTSLILLPIINIAFGIVMGLMAFIFFRKEPRRARGELSMPLLGINIGLFAFPLVEAMWGKEILKYFGMFDMGNAFVIFVLCYVVGAYYSSSSNTVDYKEIMRKTMRSVPLNLYLLTLLLNLLNLRYPTLVLNAANIISRANMPLSLLVLGIFLNFSLKKEYIKRMVKVLVIKYSTGLILGILLYAALPFDQQFRFTILTSLLLPASLSIIPYSVQFGYDTKFVGTLSNLTIIISIIFMWVLTIIF